ncbi:hypothetical protein HPB48_016807 [Haemaphysalis longicornis]|uniref:Uncharacterized protein n=1 Tax=Haemaphysalis longicornis TaxID=44386 RepID=A0A9J6GG51_HAELO|nr:hypothetical protein HPB48_016807 [Haemaphysalis longicornis]
MRRPSTASVPRDRSPGVSTTVPWPRMGLLPHQNSLPDFVCKALEPVFTCLSDEALLERCSDGITQNSNESLHALIWEQAPKSQHNSLRSIERAVAEAISRFNQGLTSSNVEVAENLGYRAGSCLVRRSLEKDEARLQRSQKGPLRQYCRQRKAGEATRACWGLRLQPWSALGRRDITGQCPLLGGCCALALFVVKLSTAT